MLSRLNILVSLLALLSIGAVTMDTNVTLSGKQKWNYDYTDYCADANTIACWRFSEDSVSHDYVLDESGNGNDLSLLDGVYATGATCQEGECLTYDGTADDSKTRTAINYGSDTISFAFWGYFTGLNDDEIVFESTVNFGTGNKTFIFIWDSTSTNGSCDGQSVNLATKDGGIGGDFLEECLNTMPSQNAWHHYVAIYDNSTASGDIKLYVDGQEETLVKGLNIQTGAGNFSTETLYIGSRASSSFFAAMRIDEFAIFSDELTATEVLDIYTNGLK